VPVLASDRGGLPEIVGEDATVPAGDPAAWIAGLSALWGDPALRAERGGQALARARDRFGEDEYYERLMRLYDGVSP
jgi:glycosyltransferase involved in cell wall biosynthesis